MVNTKVLVEVQVFPGMFLGMRARSHIVHPVNQDRNRLHAVFYKPASVFYLKFQETVM